jgi:YjbE family integral membrane protein|tara:strand:- start:6275 stop:6850 length:576 start_codon:yes stop_codon:yes gene_type:complete
MTEQLIILVEILLIDLVLAGDNAIIIGMVASKFQDSNRKKIIFWGIGGAVVLRIIFTFITAYLLQISGLRLVGGILLLYICYKLYRDVIQNKIEEKKIEVDNSNLKKAIFTVILADVTMSLDNVLGVAGAAGHHYHLLVFGLVLSIVLMAVAANLISSWIKKYKWIAWLGLLAILVVAIDLIYTDVNILFF